jgi:serine phosphatase RsbU (regulator of sigma subunit)
VGALHLADHGNHRFADRVDLLEAAGRACGPLLLRHESRELELIAALEAALRPRGLPPIPGVEFALAFSSATDSATVGGDFYDLRELAPGEVLVLVGDYCGNGVEAAGIAARIRYTLSGLAQTQPDPALLLTEAERLLAKTLPPEGFVTLLVCRLSADGRLTASAAGHPWPLRLSPEGGGQEVRLRGCPPVGTTADKTFANTEVALPPGWTLLLYTDGISDARREGVLFGVAGIVRTWRRTGDRGLAAFVQSLRAEAEGFHADPTSRDDRLAVALRWTRAGAEGAGHRHASRGWPGDRDEEGGSKDHVA